MINSRLIVAALLIAACLTQIKAAVQSANPPVLRSATKSRPAALKSMTPVEDISLESDASELFNQAMKAYASGLIDKAEKLFEQTLELDSLNVDAHFNLGAIKEWHNNLSAALQEYRAALDLKPRDQEIAEAIRAVEYKIKHNDALQALTARLKHQSDLKNHSRLAKEAFADENFSAAVQHLTWLSDALPDDAKIQFALGQSLRALKCYDWAAYRLKRAIYLSPDNEMYRQALVKLDQEIQDTQARYSADLAAIVLQHIASPTFTGLAKSGGAPDVF